MTQRKRIHRCGCRECRSRRDAEVIEYHRCINRVMVDLDERSRRLFAGVLARPLGRGGAQRVNEVTGLSRGTIRRGLRESEQVPSHASGRIRAAGGGRKRVEKKFPRVHQELNELLKDATAGDPMGGVRWTHKTTRKLATDLRRRGVVISRTTVARLLKEYPCAGDTTMDENYSAGGME